MAGAESCYGAAMVDDRAHQYRDRAEEIRTCAEAMRDQSARKTMLHLAECYEAMAQRQAASRPIKLEIKPNI
jgi:pyruvate-formate lyase